MEAHEPALAYAKRHYTIEEYLELEDAATEKHEYYKGEIFEMSGAKRAHNFIASNLLIAVGIDLGGESPCLPLTSDQRVHIESNTLFTYPDLTIVCGEPLYRNDDDMNLLNPSVIFEILSPSTRKYDEGAKFDLYKQIPSLREYVLIDSTKIDVKCLVRNGDDFWQESKWDGVDDIFLIRTTRTAIPLRTIYKRTELI